jgi:hypothetical protein
VTVAPSADVLTWRVLAPETIQGSELTTLSSFRGAVLFADGRRPVFSDGAGGFRDEDPNDRRSYHVVVRSRDALVGCTRLTPLASVDATTVERIFGRVEIDALLSRLGGARDGCVEGGRWIVAPAFRGGVVGRLLLGALWVLGRRLGAEYALGAAGTRDGQVALIRRVGGIVADVAARRIPELDDDVALTYFALQRPPPKARALIARLEPVLRLESA